MVCTCSGALPASRARGEAAFLIVRLRPSDGLPDPSFAGNGKLAVVFPSALSFGRCILQDWQGFIYGSRNRGAFRRRPHNIRICRVTQSGALDTRFRQQRSGYDRMERPGRGERRYFATKQWEDRRCGFRRSRWFCVRDIIIPLSPAPSGGDCVGYVAGDREPGGVWVRAGVRVFPNPATSMLKVQGLDEQGSTLLLVRDAVGKTMMSFRAERQSGIFVGCAAAGAGPISLRSWWGTGGRV